MESMLKHRVVIAGESGKQVEIFLTEAEKVDMESLPPGDQIPYLNQLINKSPARLKEINTEETVGSSGKTETVDEVKTEVASSSKENNTDTDKDIKEKLDLDSLDYGDTEEPDEKGLLRGESFVRPNQSQPIAPLLLASVEQAHMLEPAVPTVDMCPDVNSRMKPRFGVMIVGAIFTQQHEIKEGAIESLRKMQEMCGLEGGMVLILEDTRNYPDLTRLDEALGYDKGKIWSIVRSCRGFELLSLMSSPTNEGAFDYLIGNGKVHKFETERCFNLKSHCKTEQSWVTKSNGLYVGNWVSCLEWVEEKLSMPITMSIDLESWPVDEACAKMIKGWTSERFLAVLGRGPILSGGVESLIAARAKALPPNITSLISMNAKNWFRDAMTNWLRRKQTCIHEGFSVNGYPETDLAKILTLHAFIRGWDTRQPSGPMCKERTLSGNCSRIPCSICNVDTIKKATKVFDGASVREIQKELQPGLASGPRGAIQNMALDAEDFALEGQAAVFMQEWSSFTKKGADLILAAEKALSYRVSNAAMTGETIMSNIKIYRYTAAESANGLDMCLMVGGSEAAIDVEKSTKCAQALDNFPCLESPCSICRTFLKFTIVLRYIGEQKDRPAMWQATPLPTP